MSTEVATRGPVAPATTEDEKLSDYLFKAADKLAPVLPRGVTPEQVITFVLTAAVKNTDLHNCTKQSVLLSLIRCAQLGLDVGIDAHLVPCKNKIKGRNGEADRWETTCELWPDYRGLIRLAKEARVVNHIEADVVYDGDTFSFEKGTGAFLRHTPGPVAKRGKMTAAYAIIDLPGGKTTFHVMPIEEIEQRRGKSKQWNPEKAGATPLPWYAKKTVVKDWLNRQPKRGKLAAAMVQDDDVVEGETVTPDGEVITTPAPPTRPPMLKGEGYSDEDVGVS